MFSRLKKPVFAVVSLASAFAMAGCGRSEYHRAEGLIWNTAYHITFKGEPALEDSVMRVLDEVGSSLNVFDTTSLVCRVNRNTATQVDDHFKRVYKASLDVNRRSGGMFDPTLSPLITAWGFGPGHKPTADTLDIPALMQRVGIGKTRLKGDTLIKDNPAISFNFSAVAKGYACDAVAAMLRRNKVTDFLVEIGGEITAAGVSPSRSQWKVSVDRPVASDSILHDSSAIIKMTDAGMATSGNYRNFHRENGATFGHTISPVTGRPVATDVVSATIVAPTATMADAMATACMAAGSETAKKMVTDAGYEALLILADSTLWTTPGLGEQLAPR